MCKLLCILDIENQDDAIEFSEKAIKPMTEKDNDGLGVILLGNEGMGVERWLKPGEFPKTYEMNPKLSKYQALIPNGYNTEGATSQTGLYALGVHARMATGAKTLQNVHPFVRDGLALIHNGVINNHNAFKKEVSTCDSEALLSLYLEHDVKSSLENIQKVADLATGWYAFMVFNPETKTVDIIKDDRTSLWFASVPGVGTVFCTALEIIKSSCGKMKIPQPEIYPFPSDTAMRWKLGSDTVETFELSHIVTHYGTGWGEDSTSLIDVSKENKCTHGVYPTRWCHVCKNEEKFDKDLSHFLTEKR
jgi:hypothetical protein